MLGANKLPLRQGFGPKAQNACTAHERRRPEGRYLLVGKYPDWRSTSRRSKVRFAPRFRPRPAALGSRSGAAAARRFCLL